MLLILVLDTKCVAGNSCQNYAIEADACLRILASSGKAMHGGHPVNRRFRCMLVLAFSLRLLYSTLHGGCCLPPTAAAIPTKGFLKQPQQHSDAYADRYETGLAHPAVQARGNPLPCDINIATNIDTDM